MNPLSIALIHDRYATQGGVERNVHALAVGLSQRGHRVTIVASQFRSSLPHGVSAVTIPSFGPQWNRRRTFPSLAGAHCVQAHYDVLQAFDVAIPGAFVRLGRPFAALAPVRTDLQRGPVSRWLKRISPLRRVDRAREAAMFQAGAVRHLVGISHRVLRDAREAYPACTTPRSVIYNGVDLRHFAPTSTPMRGGDRTILFAGTGFQRKGLAELLRALPHVRRQEPGVRLVVAGRDGRADIYRRLARQLGIENAVVWHGVVGDMKPLYDQASLLVFPTHFEPFGNVTLEALACGLPVVISRIAGSSEVLDGTALADLIVNDCNNPDELAAAIVRGLSHGEPLRPVARGVAEGYTLQRMLDGYENLYAMSGGLP